MKSLRGVVAGALTTVLCSGVLCTSSLPASASEEGRHNTANALAALAAGLLLTGRDKTPGIIAGAAAAYAYKRHQDAVNERHRWERYGYYNDPGYRDSYYQGGYNTGDRNCRRNGYYTQYGNGYDYGQEGYGYRQCDRPQYNHVSYYDDSSRSCRHSHKKRCRHGDD